MDNITVPKTFADFMDPHKGQAWQFTWLWCFITLSNVVQHLALQEIAVIIKSLSVTTVFKTAICGLKL